MAASHRPRFKHAYTQVSKCEKGCFKRRGVRSQINDLCSQNNQFTFLFQSQGSGYLSSSCLSLPGDGVAGVYLMCLEPWNRRAQPWRLLRGQRSSIFCLGDLQAHGKLQNRTTEDRQPGIGCQHLPGIFLNCFCMAASIVAGSCL